MSMWARAGRIAEQTPENRNRYVDFLRALSIGVVVLGHWVMAAPYLEEGIPRLAHLLDVAPWSHWLTWGFQVMPVFFFVGGFSNGTSWDGAQKKDTSYSEWLEARMRRLLGPVVPLILTWLVLAIVGDTFGVPAAMISRGSQVAIIPVWFLAIYLVIVMLVPLSRRIWHKLGLWSIAAPMLIAGMLDWAFFNTNLQWLGWFNYLFVWSAVHQLGYAWQTGRLTGFKKASLLFVFGAGALILLTQFLGAYPTSLVGVPSETISNTRPPKLPLLALGLGQIGLLLLFEQPMRRWLAHRRVWTATVLVNGMIMPLFLWHSTGMMLVVGAAFWLWPEILSAVPGTGEWWMARTAWALAYALITAPFVGYFAAVEAHIYKRLPASPALGWLLAGALLLGTGLALLAAGGIDGAGPLGVDWIAVSLALVGATLCGFGPHRLLQRS